MPGYKQISGRRAPRALIIILFQSQSHSYGGKNGAPPAVKYIPLPHHDLPVLIYQSVNKPPIHVVHTPAPATPYSPPKKQPYQGRTLCMTSKLTQCTILGTLKEGRDSHDSLFISFYK